MNQLATHFLILLGSLAGGLPAVQAVPIVAAKPEFPTMGTHRVSGSTKVDVVCKADGIGVRDAACRTLRAALAKRTPDQGAWMRLDVDIEWLRVEPEFLIARLVWWQDGGARQSGPEIEVSVNDRDVTESDAVQLAETLVKMTPLPL